MIENKRKRHYVWWTSNGTKNALLAGTALHDGGSDEYEIRLHLFPDQKYLLRPVGSCEGTIKYRMETMPKRKRQNPTQRQTVGTGFFNPENSNRITITIEPFCKRLALAI